MNYSVHDPPVQNGTMTTVLTMFIFHCKEPEKKDKHQIIHRNFLMPAGWNRPKTRGARNDAPK
jgi:hypothetical protein